MTGANVDLKDRDHFVTDYRAVIVHNFIKDKLLCTADNCGCVSEKRCKLDLTQLSV